MYLLVRWTCFTPSYDFGIMSMLFTRASLTLDNFSFDCIASREESTYSKVHVGTTYLTDEWARAQRWAAINLPEANIVVLPRLNGLADCLFALLVGSKPCTLIPEIGRVEVR